MGMMAVLSTEDGHSTDLDKSWHGIHYVLTGKSGAVAGLEGFLLSGGEELDEDMGFGPPRIFSADETRKISELMTATDPRARFDGVAMDAAGVYPGVWSRGPEEFEYLESNFYFALSFIQAAVKRGQCIEIGIC